MKPLVSDSVIAHSIRAVRAWWNLGAQSKPSGKVAPPDWPVVDMNLPANLTEEEIDYTRALELLPDIYSVISLLQDSIAALPVQFYEPSANGEERIIEDGEDPVVDLFRNGNRTETGYELTHSLVGHFFTNGNAYVFLDYEGVNPIAGLRAKNSRLIPSGMWCLPSHWTKPVSTAGRKVDTFSFLEGGTIPKTIPAEQVVHIPDFNINDDGVGVSRLESLRLTYETQRDAERYQREFYKRGGVAAGMFSTEQALSEPDRARLKEDLRTESEGPENAWRPVLLPRNLKYVRSALTHSEMQFLETADLTTSKILRAFKVPPSLFGIRVGGLGASDKGLSQDQLIMVTYAMKPVTRRIEARFNERMLKELFGLNVRMRFDYSNEPALQDVFLAQAESLKNVLGEAVITVNEARKRLSLPPLGAEYDQLPKPTPPPPAPGVAQPPEPPANMPGKKPMRSETFTVNPDELDILLRDPDDISTRYMRQSAYREVERHVEHARGRVLELFGRQEKRIRRALKGDGTTRHDRAFTSDQLVSLLESDADRALIRKMFTYILRGAGQAALQEVGAELAFRLTTKAAQDLVAGMTKDFAEHVNGTTARGLAETLSDGIGKGESTAALIERVHEVFGDRRANVALIARTEAHGAMNGGRLEAGKQAGLKFKTWLASEDEYVRGRPGGEYEHAKFSHYHADGQTVRIDEPFKVGNHSKNSGEQCMFPGDRTLSAGNRCNCRCIVLLVPNAPTRADETPIEELLAND